MPNIYGYPSNATLKRIAQDKLPVLVANDPIFSHFPIRTENTSTVLWEIKDNYIGLQLVRGINGAYSAVSAVGINRYAVVPGYYGEHMEVDELALTNLRVEGTFGTTIDVSRLVLDRQEQLLQREITRMRFVAWSMCYGRFSSLTPAGATLHTDVFSIQTYDSNTTLTTVPSNWSNETTGTPLADMRNLPIFARGHSAQFDRRARAYMNRTTANWLLNNNNQADLRGKYIGNLGSIMTMNDLNSIMVGADLPQVVIYDDGYYDSTGTWQLYIPNGDVIVIGARDDGSAVGGIVQTRNASNEGGAPGPYDEAVESREPPKTIKVFRGVNYAPVIEYPSCVIRMKADGTAFSALA